ncbi:hypothetical protein P20652_2243 [Pseudoalteromonas sp. BSi20652]|nr:hypothetical protein P20652_2243 [Pseudoalteromonas sp. BSi20652]
MEKPRVLIVIYWLCNADIIEVNEEIVEELFINSPSTLN